MEVGLIGSAILVTKAVNFDDDSYILPETNIYMDIKTKQELPPGA